MDIKNKVIALIGSTGILGSEYVKFLSSKGANVIIGDMRQCPVGRKPAYPAQTKFSIKMWTV